MHSVLPLRLCMLLLAAPLLADELNVYGMVNIGLVWLDNGSTRQWKVENLYALSRLGFKGSADLGEGQQVFFKLETQVKPDDGNAAAFNPSGLGNREGWVGISGPAGRLGLGRGYHPYQDMTNLFDWHEGAALFGGFAINLHDRLLPARFDNAIRYDCPAARPLSCALMWSAGENRVAGSGASNNWSGYLRWKDGGWSAALALAGLDNLRDSLGQPQAGRHTRAVLWALSHNGAMIDTGLQQQYGRTEGGALVADTRWTTQGYVLLREAQRTWKVSVMHGADRKLAGQPVPDSSYTRYALGVKQALSQRTAVIAETGGERSPGSTPDARYLTLGLLHSF